LQCLERERVKEEMLVKQERLAAKVAARRLMALERERTASE